ncbi:SRPBCC family protein [Vibrio sp. CAU 1672]|uniref:SRPBCC family protein n=1 Tax=Vibrio sp. CAU 1672 TaxID=3032594 RepID=UPI0023DC17A3|nr:SRPBCC family protein [Vibrio sp. CAU 1672]MDF2153388.1 SRPBCC family protein [Vibrio sp. CAU 1672]
MLSYQVSRTIEICRPQAEVVDYLKDFRNWPQWSPWIILEPESELTFSNEQGHVGAGYQWNGRRIGMGTVILESTQPHRLDMELEVFRPVRSHAKVTLLVNPTTEGCSVEWQMTSRVPWFLFFLKNIFKSMISMDYERGLRMLKSQLETGRVLSELSDMGERDQGPISYIGVAGSGTLSEVGPMMQEHIQRLSSLVEKGTIKPDGVCFSYYLSMDIKREYFEFVTCLPVESPVNAPQGFVSGTIDESETYVVAHKGAYRFLGNAWSMAMSLARAKNIKVKTKPLGIERYLNSPSDVEEAELMTEVILFKK